MKGMDLETKELLAMTGDTSKEAIGKRLAAARLSSGFQQKEFANLLKVAPQTYNSMEKKGAPSISAMRILYRAYRIDFNFILHGDFAQLPLDVQTSLFAALLEKSQRDDRKPS